MSIYKNGVWTSNEFINYRNYVNLWKGSGITKDWRDLNATFDGEYLTLNGQATTTLTGNGGSGFYDLISYEGGKTYTLVISYMSGNVTGTGNGIGYAPNGFKKITITNVNYMDTQTITKTFSSDTTESTGYSLYDFYSDLQFNNLILKVQVVEGEYNPGKTTQVKIFKDKTEANDFYEI